MARPINLNRLNFRDNIMRVEITGVKLFTFRIRLGLLFVRIGVWITGLGFQCSPGIAVDLDE
jgi:hypothetical protein